MSIFDLTLDLVFADPNVAVDAVYTPPGGGTAVPCRITFAQPDRDWQGLGVGVNAPSRVVEVLTADVSTVAEKGVFTVGGESLKVTKVSHKDSARHIWTCEVA